MQKLFFKSFSFLVGISLILNALGRLADRVAPLDDWRAAHRVRSDRLQARQEHIEAVTLGNSHADSIDYAELDIEGQSLAFTAADLFEVEQYAAYLDTRLPNLKTVFIALSYYSFSRDNATFEPFRTRRIQFYSMVPTWSPIQGDQANFVMGRLESYTQAMSVVRSDNWQTVWTEMSNGLPAPDPFPYYGIRTDSAWGECSHFTEAQLEAHARETARRNISSSTRMAAAHPGLAQDAYDALARTIERLQSRGIQVILFTPVFYQAYNAYFEAKGSGIVEQLLESTDRLQQAYHVGYYNLSSDPDIAIHPELFYNSDHLNECGNGVFTQKLLQVMRANDDFDK